MTEAEWLACIDPGPMLDFLKDKTSDRKLQLFACECCRHVIHLFRFDEERSLLDKAEQYAESKIGKDDLRRSAVELLMREPLSLSDAQEALFTLAGITFRILLPSGAISVRCLWILPAVRCCWTLSLKTSYF